MTVSRTMINQYDERRILFIIMLSVIVLNIIMFSVIMLNVIMLNVIMLSVVMLSVVATFSYLGSGSFKFVTKYCDIITISQNLWVYLIIGLKSSLKILNVFQKVWMKIGISLFVFFVLLKGTNDIEHTHKFETFSIMTLSIALNMHHSA